MRDDVGAFIWNMAVADEKYEKSPAYNSDLREWQSAKNAALDELAKSDDKLVSWIANNEHVRSSYIREAMEILEAIPASLSDYDKIARNSNWCGVWNDLRAEALRAGVIELDMKFEWRENAGRWHNMRQAISIGGRTHIKKDAILPLFIEGATTVQLEVGNSFLTIRAQTSESPTERSSIFDD